LANATDSCRKDVKKLEQIIQQLINGVSLGSIYALIALGYTMVYGIINLINFAHGDIYMMGAFVGYALTTFLGIGFTVINGRLQYIRGGY
jgi:branched-subunit amino acid ABC-type transport system permease component